MVKSELVASLAKAHPHLSQTDVERVVSTILDAIVDKLCEGGGVELRGFGTFAVQARGPRLGRNPRSGEQVQVAAKPRVGFKSGKALRERLNTVD